MQFYSGTVNVNTTAVVPATINIAHTGGYLAGTGVLEVSGVYDWTAGNLGSDNTIPGGGSLDIKASGVMNITGNGAKNMGYWGIWTINNEGTVNYSATSVIYIYNASVINNLAGGIFDIKIVDSLDRWVFSQASGIFNNFGLLKKSAGTKAAMFQIPVNNTGRSACSLERCI